MLRQMSRAINTPKKASIHVHARTYFAEQDAQPLVDWLNSRARKKNDPVLALKGTISEMEKPDAFLDPLTEEARARLEVGYGLLFRPSLTMVYRQGKRIGGWEFSWEPVNEADRKQQLALVTLFELASQDLASRVRMCSCGRWFWARFERQHFHSKKCQEGTYKGTPEWKAGRAAYMRRLRHLHKQRER